LQTGTYRCTVDGQPSTSGVAQLAGIRCESPNAKLIANIKTGLGVFEWNSSSGHRGRYQLSEVKKIALGGNDQSFAFNWLLSLPYHHENGQGNLYVDWSKSFGLFSNGYTTVEMTCKEDF
jgi:hypothetical protein